jgi:hypothetical protein
VPVLPDEQAVHFATHPGVKAIIVPLWMIEKIYVDFCTSPQELVVQLKEEEETRGEEDESN